MRHRPAYAIASIVLLALGIGAVGAIFSVVDVALLRPLPYADPAGLLSLHALEPVTTDSSRPYPLAHEQLARWRSDAQLFAGIEGAIPRNVTLGGEAEPEALQSMQVSAGLFGLLGTNPARGRSFTREEEFTGSTVTIVSHNFWKNRLQSDANVLGRTLTLDGISRTIVGVMPAGFSVLFINADVWIPLPLDASVLNNRYRGIITLGRLKPGVTPAQGVADLNRINDAIGSEIAQYRRTRARITPLKEDLFGSDRGPLLVISGAVALLLLIGAANVLNLTLSDAMARRQGTMVRLALGASRGHVVARRLGEMSIITAAAAVFGIGLGRLALATLNSIDPSVFSGFGDISFNGRLVAATLGVALIAGMVAAVPAALAESRLSVITLASAAAHSVGNRVDQRVRELLLAAQVSLALVLLFAAALLAKNLRTLTEQPQGFNANGLLTVSFAPAARYATFPDRANYMRQVVDAIGQVPGVTSVSATQGHFSLGSSSQTFLAIQGVSLPDSTGIISHIRHVMPNIFSVMGTKVLEGRAFDSNDREGTLPVALVSASFARQHLGGKAIGARLRRTAHPSYVWMEVVGVVDEVKDAGVGVDLGPTVYVPYLQSSQPAGLMTVVAKLRDTALPMERSIKSAIWGVDRAQSISEFALMSQLQRESSAQPRFQTFVVTLFGAGALLLVVGGIYALTLFSILKRTREIGVRAALGASPAEILGDAIRRGLRPLVVGIGFGLVMAVPSVRLMQRALHQELNASDLPLLAIVLAALVVAAMLAAVIPARRANKVSPLEAMRS